MAGSLTRRSVLASVAVLGLGAGSVSARDDAPVVAAAANLEFALTEIAERFRAETGMQVRLSFGSTGNLSRQIRQGAPFQLLLAADDATPIALNADGFARDEGIVFAVGRLVLVAPNGSPLDVRKGLDGVAELLASGRISRFAIANPEHAPFGIAARQALITRNLWDDLQPLLVLGENVSQAAQFALSGNAEGGIIAYSLALAPRVAALGTHALIPADWHEPLRQRMALLHTAGPVAEAFYAYMMEPPARAIMERHGFVLPEE
jgi:molybdate transport system substrate-binding protein